ncbi:pilus assembly PilX N-terminal domain-containing protein [Pseudomonas benzenivorans]|uniref:Pilus assembly PilX N-terminal domain-containing protein n=1 Tax=Pseudomonas benzenivorans TaxID=556533 RepID=A0ABZ0PTC8_9PSED|nr:pilus assembly PilX N-terminal domain-containing protein [Pseudomonas benzenivorans]WPC04408.1 pilus assembly PilX N-terminal domain-containing protein [Pseudomonas benzenivorans]
MSPHKQSGMVLVVSLLLLLMLTLIAISAANQSSLQLRIASNSEQQNAAFQAAESGLQQWTAEYFGAADNSAFPDDWSDQVVGSARTGYPAEQSTVVTTYSGPCPGSGIGRVSLNCFSLRSTGQVCDSGNCTATAIHLQGGQRRQLSQ